MKKFLILLALIATPAYAQEDIVAKADRELAEIKSRIARENPALAKLMAEHEATKRANDANAEKVMAQTQATIDQFNKDIAEYEKEYGPSYYRSYHYHGMPTMSYIKYRAMLRMANIPVRRY